MTEATDLAGGDYIEILDVLRAGRGAATPRMRSANGVVYSEMVKDLSELRDNDEAAAAEQAAQVWAW